MISDSRGICQRKKNRELRRIGEREDETHLMHNNEYKGGHRLLSTLHADAGGGKLFTQVCNVIRSWPYINELGFRVLGHLA